MMTKTALPNGYYLIECAWQKPEPVLPGHYITIRNRPVYIFDAKPGVISLLIPPSLSHFVIESNPLIISAIEGEPFTAPLSSDPILMLLADQTLSAGIFYIKKYRRQMRDATILIGTESGFPFHPCPSRLLTPKLPNDLIAASPLLEDWGILSRLASSQEQPGCFHGAVRGLADIWQTQYPAKWTVMAFE